MKRIIAFVIGFFMAAIPATSVQGDATTLILEGHILCASNGVDPPPFLCSPNLAVVDGAIGPGSSFEVSVTLPNVNPLPGHPGLFFPNQTAYFVPLTGGIGMSGSVDGFTFSPEELVRPPFPPPPGAVPGALRVDVANDEFFNSPFPTDLWNVFGLGSSTAIPFAENQFCDVFFASPGGQGAGGEELGNIDSQDYFVPNSLDGPVTPWNAALRCQTFDPTQTPPFQVILFGLVDQLTVIGGLQADAGPDQLVECTGPDGAFVMLDGSASTPDPPAGTYVWSVAGTQVAEGEEAEVLFSLGTHTVTLTVTEAAGLSDSDSVQITVADSTAPLVSADLIQAGDEGHKYDIVATAADVCDPAPTVEATVASFVSDGGSIVIAQPDEEGLVRVMGSMPKLEVTATDATGNSATQTDSP